MKKIKISEAKFLSLFGNKPIENDIFYQDGEFSISNNNMNKNREIFYPFYKSQYNESKSKILHQIAFYTTIRMLDKGEKIPEFNDIKIYHSINNIPFSKNQVGWVEKQIIEKYGNLSLEDLYDQMIIDREKSSFELEKDSKNAVLTLLNNGFFDKYLNGMLKDVALWSVNKLNNIDNMLNFLYSKNRFTKDLNYNTIIEMIKKTCDEIADTNDSFMADDTFIALNYIKSSLSKINKIPK
jgi:hypothetical protein